MVLQQDELNERTLLEKYQAEVIYKVIQVSEYEHVEEVDWLLVILGTILLKHGNYLVWMMLTVCQSCLHSSQRKGWIWPLTEVGHKSQGNEEDSRIMWQKRLAKTKNDGRTRPKLTKYED